MNDRPESRPKRLTRVVFVLPSAFTLGNLFFGFWAIVAATRGALDVASWLIFYAAVLDWVDGRVARLARTHTSFGAELDSLVDVVSFGVAPAFIMYRAFFDVGEWSWLVCFAFASAVAVRLARFNVEQGGRAKVHFLGLPSPAAGVLVASFYPFSTTAFFQAHLSAWPWHRLLAIGLVVLGALMLSHLPYPILRPSLRERSRQIVLVLMAVSVGLISWHPAELTFPILLAYATYGVVVSFVREILDQLSSRDFVAEEMAAEADEGKVGWE